MSVIHGQQQKNGFARSLLQLSLVVCGSFFIFFKQVKCSKIRLKSGHWPGHCRIFHFQTFKNSWAAFTLCFRSLPFCTLKCPPVKFAAFARTLQKVTLCSLQKMYLCKCESWPSAKEAMLIHASYCLCCTFLNVVRFRIRTCQSLLHTFFSTVILLAVFVVFGNFIILSFSSLNTFASCGDPSVFLFVKSSS